MGEGGITRDHQSVTRPTQPPRLAQLVYKTVTMLLSDRFECVSKTVTMLRSETQSLMGMQNCDHVEIGNTGVNEYVRLSFC